MHTILLVQDRHYYIKIRVWTVCGQKARNHCQDVDNCGDEDHCQTGNYCRDREHCQNGKILLVQQDRH